MCACVYVYVRGVRTVVVCAREYAWSVGVVADPCCDQARVGGVLKYST